MSRIIISTVFDSTKSLASSAGQDLKDFINYSTQTFEIVVRNLRNLLTFEDNFLCDVKVATIGHNTDTEIYTKGRQPRHVLFTRVNSPTTLLLASGWYLNDTGNLVVRAQFTPTPASGNTLDVTLILLY